jgi:hypothetical protein
MACSQMFHADINAGGQHVRLILAAVADGWLGAAVYPDTKESISLFELPDIEDAKAKAEGWVRIVHNVRDVIEWIPGPPDS